MACVRPGGVCIIEHSSSRSYGATTALDPLGVNAELLPWLILKWSEGHFTVTTVLDASRHRPGQHISFFIIRHTPCPE